MLALRMSAGNVLEVVVWMEVDSSAARMRNKAVCFSAGSGVVGRTVDMKEASHDCVGVSDFEERCVTTCAATFDIGADILDWVEVQISSDFHSTTVNALE